MEIRAFEIEGAFSGQLQRGGRRSWAGLPVHPQNRLVDGLFQIRADRPHAYDAVLGKVLHLDRPSSIAAGIRVLPFDSVPPSPDRASVSSTAKNLLTRGAANFKHLYCSLSDGQSVGVNAHEANVERGWSNGVVRDVRCVDLVRG